MKLLFFISSSGGNAAGGHYNSLHQVTLEMAKTNEVKIVMLGKVLSPVIKDNPYLFKHFVLGHSIKDIFSFNKQIKDLFKTYIPDVIHCFDTNSLNRSLLSTAINSIPIVINKCGGPNPIKDNYQHADATIVFSRENQEWYLNSRYYKNDSIFLIPNRVRALDLLPESLQQEKANPNKITFVRVSRLGGAYEMTLLQTFNLLEELSLTLGVELFVIGRIQDKDRFNNLVKEGEQKNFNITYITDERAAQGSSFLYLADFVVGTGRSFMEATSLGIPTLTPAQNSDIPILVNAKNVEQFLATNFSERNIAKKNDKKTTLRIIKELIVDKSEYAKQQKETKFFFEEYFGTEKINQKYTSVYKYATSKSCSKINLFRKNFLYILKFIIKGN
jgi:glycosyltransferase involved in cell wall biosynthesis